MKKAYYTISMKQIVPVSEVEEFLLWAEEQNVHTNFEPTRLQKKDFVKVNEDETLRLEGFWTNPETGELFPRAENTLPETWVFEARYVKGLNLCLPREAFPKVEGKTPQEARDLLRIELLHRTREKNLKMIPSGPKTRNLIHQRGSYDEDGNEYGYGLRIARLSNFRGHVSVDRDLLNNLYLPTVEKARQVVKMTGASMYQIIRYLYDPSVERYRPAMIDEEVYVSPALLEYEAQQARQRAEDQEEKVRWVERINQLPDSFQVKGYEANGWTMLVWIERPTAELVRGSVVCMSSMKLTINPGGAGTPNTQPFNLDSFTVNHRKDKRKFKRRFEGIMPAEMFQAFLSDWQDNVFSLALTGVKDQIQAARNPATSMELPEAEETITE